jgi:uncharacterized protein YgiM (DUF1202 family)
MKYLKVKVVLRVFLCIFLSGVKIYAFNYPFIGESTSDRVNVRTGPKLNCEVICQLSKGDKVEVHKKEKDWFCIKSPKKIYVWVNKKFIKNKKVTCKRLNIRSGPGLAYSILGQFKKGASVNILGTKGEWGKTIVSSNIFFWVNYKYIKYICPKKKYADYLNEIEKVKNTLSKADDFFHKEIKKKYPEVKFSEIYGHYQKIIRDYPKTESAKIAIARIAEVKKQEKILYSSWKKSARRYRYKGSLSKSGEEWCLRRGFLGARIICFLRFEKDYVITHRKRSKVQVIGRILFYYQYKHKKIPVILVERIEKKKKK